MTGPYNNDDRSQYIHKDSKWNNIKRSLWDPEEKTFLGRTAQRWGIVLIFYIIFYTVLAAFFSICMFGLLATLSYKRPKYTLEDSLIGTNPGMGFRPQFVDEYSLIWYNVNNQSHIKKYLDDIQAFLKPYINKTEITNLGKCDYGELIAIDAACDVQIDSFNFCTADNNYGYKDGTPCVFLKMNRIFDWTPDYYNNINDLPQDMPETLKSYIINETNSDIERQRVWISCEGENDLDKQNIAGPRGIGTIRYDPAPGLPYFYYPYTNQLGYLSPIVAFQLTDPQRAQIINIRCRAWAKNIKFSKSHKDIVGATHVEIMIDDDK